MSFLPIVERELRSAARKGSTYRSRTGFVLVTGFMAAGLLLIGDTSPGKQMGNTLFSMLGTLAFFYCLFAGARHAGDCLSEEKREGTMGLLFLTDLRGYDVVLGKLVAVSAQTFQGLFAFFPVLAVGLVLGGITPGEFWRTVAVLTNTLFFSLSLALFISALSRESARALAGTFILLVLLTGLPPSVDWAVAKLGWLQPGMIAALSPAAPALRLEDTAYRMQPGLFWSELGLNFGMGICFLLLASKVLPRSWQERSVPPTHANSRWFGRSRPERATGDAARTALRQQLLEINPIYWLAARDDTQRRWVWTFVVVAFLSEAGLFLLNFHADGFVFGSIASVLSFGSHILLKVWVAWRACSTLAEARRTGAIELLLATPLTVEQIILGQWQALRRFFLWPVLAALTVTGVPTIAAMLQQSSPITVLRFPLPAVTIFSMATFILDLIAIGWVGMWMGLSQTKPVTAFAKTLLFAMVIPAVIFCFPNLIFDLFWITWAKRKLEHEFRSSVTGRTGGTLTATEWLLPPPPPVALPPVITHS